MVVSVVVWLWIRRRKRVKTSVVSKFNTINMNRDRLNKLEEIGFRITMVIVFTTFTIWLIGTIVKLLMLVF